MEKAKEWICPYYHKVVDADECYDMYFIAMRAFRDDDLVKEEDRDQLFAMCEKCQKHGVIPYEKSEK